LQSTLLPPTLDPFLEILLALTILFLQVSVRQVACGFATTVTLIGYSLW